MLICVIAQKHQFLVYKYKINEIIRIFKYIYQKINKLEVKMAYLYLLLIPTGLILLVLSIKQIVHFANAKVIYEMPCTSTEESFKIVGGGKYSIWLSGKKLKKSPMGEFGLNIINKETGENVHLSESILRTSVSGFKTARLELYSFEAEDGEYVISMNEKVSARDKVYLFLGNLIDKNPVDYSIFSIQIREHNSIFILSIFGIISGFLMIHAGIFAIVKHMINTPF